MLPTSVITVVFVVDIMINFIDNHDEKLVVQVTREEIMPAPPVPGMVVLFNANEQMFPDGCQPVVELISQPEISALAYDTEGEHYIAHCLPGDADFDMPYSPNNAVGSIGDSIIEVSNLTDSLDYAGWNVENVYRVKSHAIRQQYWHVLYSN